MLCCEFNEASHVRARHVTLHDEEGFARRWPKPSNAGLRSSPRLISTVNPSEGATASVSLNATMDAEPSGFQKIATRDTFGKVSFISSSAFVLKSQTDLNSASNNRSDNIDRDCKVRGTAGSAFDEACSTGQTAGVG
jgi:hypothetical protein